MTFQQHHTARNGHDVLYVSRFVVTVTCWHVKFTHKDINWMFIAPKDPDFCRSKLIGNYVNGRVVRYTFDVQPAIFDHEGYEIVAIPITLECPFARIAIINTDSPMDVIVLIDRKK